MLIASALKRKIDITLIDEAELGFRRHLGASLIGRDCSKALFYSFRWASKPDWKRLSAKIAANEDLTFDEEDLVTRYGSLMRLFWRGHEEEPRFIKLLTSVGVAISDRDPITDEQYRITGVFGHFGGSLDGIITQHPEEVELPEGEGVSEFKTHNLKSFEKLLKEGVQQAKPEHYIQMQIYMRKREIEWALYMAVCKNDDRIHTEIVWLDEAEADKYEERAERIITATDAPPRISNSPAFFGCKFCDYTDLCHGDAVPEVNCRTCAHSTPVNGGEWTCAMARAPGIIPRHIEPVGCSKHVFLPALLNVEYLGGNGRNAEYRLRNKEIILQGPDGIKSKDLCSLAGTN